MAGETQRKKNPKLVQRLMVTEAQIGEETLKLRDLWEPCGFTWVTELVIIFSDITHFSEA